MNHSNNNAASRRQFLGSSTAFLSGTILSGSSIFSAPNIIHDLFKPKSKIKGVQIGVITYSFRDLPDQSAEATLQYVLDAGIQAIELMGDPAETFAGRPKNPVDMKTVFPLMRKRFEKQTLTEEEKKRLAEVDALMTEYRKEVNQWRQTAPIAKFEQLGKMYKRAGVKIYAFKPDAFGIQSPDHVIAYGMQAAKAMGANQVTLEHPSNDEHTNKLGLLAQKHSIKIGYHGHEQQTPTFWDTALAQSKGNALNLDLGHYIAAGHTNGLELIRAKHDRIVSMHIKDRQNPAHGKGNLPWGQGDTPIADALKLIRDQKYTFPATIEMEYKIPDGSTSVAEVKKCLEFCRMALS